MNFLFYKILHIECNYNTEILQIRDSELYEWQVQGYDFISIREQQVAEYYFQINPDSIAISSWLKLLGDYQNKEIYLDAQFYYNHCTHLN